jgi:hypothetical protein
MRLSKILFSVVTCLVGLSPWSVCSETLQPLLDTSTFPALAYASASLDAKGDINGFGFQDCLVGAHGYKLDSKRSGSALLFMGPQSLTLFGRKN